MNYKETDDIWRLYHREWVIVHTITMSGINAEECVTAAHAWCGENLEGRVRPEDVQLEVNTDTAMLFWCHVKVFRENLKGEFKYVDSARVYAMQEGYDDYVIVPRNSKSDHDIRSQGVTKL